MDTEIKDGSRLHYAWMVALGAVILSFFCQSTIATSSQYVSAITSELGISRAAFMITFSIRPVVALICNLLYGPISKKLGIRMILAIGIASTVLAQVLNSFTNSLIVFYLDSILFGIALASTGAVTVAVLINNWFSRHQGTLIGILMASVSAGASIMTQVAVWSLNTYGWRFSYRLTAVIALVVAIPAILLIRDKPSDKGIMPYGIELDVSDMPVGKRSEVTGVILKDAVKTKRFWLGFFGFFLIGSCVHPVFTVLPGYVTDSGLAPAAAGIVTGVAYVAAATSKIILGKVYDRHGLISLIWISFLCFPVSSFLFYGSLTPALLVPISAVFGVSLCAVTMVSPLFVATVFGRKDYATFAGIFVALIQGGTALVSPLLGLTYDLTGSYKPCILILVGVSFVGLALVLVAMRGKKYYIPGLH